MCTANIHIKYDTIGDNEINITDLFIQYYFGIFGTTAQFHNQFSDVVEIDHSSGASNETMQ